MKRTVISLYDYTGEAAKPWAIAGYACVCFDIQHSKVAPHTERYQGGGSITYIHADLYDREILSEIVMAYKGDAAFMMAFPVCTDMAVSGADHFADKLEADALYRDKAVDHAVWCAKVGDALGCPYFIENPRSVLSTHWRKPDHSFEPFHYGGYIPDDEAHHPKWPDYIAPRDAYPKTTYLWTGNGFTMPEPRPAIHRSTKSWAESHRKQRTSAAPPRADLHGQFLKPINPNTKGPSDHMLKLLDLYCCGGGAGFGYEQAGFEVTGVDLYPQPKHRGSFMQADAIEYVLEHGHEYDVIHASPPCQAYSLSSMQFRKDGKEYPDLVAPTRAALMQTGRPYVIENVPGSPLIDPIELCGSMFGMRTYRHRLFECSFSIDQPNHPPHVARNAKMGRPPKDDEFIQYVGHFPGVKLVQEMTGLHWLGQKELAQSIPPQYTKFIGDILMKKLNT